MRLLAEGGGCDMNKASDYGITPLGAAAANGHDSCVEILLAAPGINVNHVNDSGDNMHYWVLAPMS